MQLLTCRIPISKPDDLPLPTKGSVANINLDELKANYQLAEALGLRGRYRHSVTALAQKLVQHRHVDPLLPEGYEPRHTSRYFKLEVVGDENLKRNIQIHINRSIDGNLDNVCIDGILANYFELNRKQSAPMLAAALVAGKYLSALIPDNYSPRADSNYFRAEIVGPEQASKNVQALFVRNYHGNIDLLEPLSPFEALFGTTKGAYKEVARELISRGFGSVIIPDGYIPKNSTCLYLCEDVVGLDAVEKNLKKIIGSRRYRTIDDVERDETLATALGTARAASPVDLCRALISRGVLAAHPPSGYEFPPRSRFFSEAFVGFRAIENIRRYALREWAEDLDAVEFHWGMAANFSIGANASIKQFCRKLIEHGILSPNLPSGHSLQREKHPTRYIDPEIVGAECAKENIKRYVQQNFMRSGEISKRRFLHTWSVSKVLGCTPDISSIREHCMKEGWFPPASPELVDTLPPQFTGTPPRDSSNLPKDNRPFSIRTEFRGRNSRWQLVKGEAFEQLVGVALAAVYPSEKVISQFCLSIDASSGFFGTRVDFKVGKKLVEAKWGKARENIRDTNARHLALKKEDQSYTVVCLRTNRALAIDHCSFSRLVENNVLAKDLLRCARLIARAAHNHNTEELEIFRDFLYSSLLLLNNTDTEQKLSMLGQRLKVFEELQIDRRNRLLTANTSHTFPPLLAHFEFEGQIYRSMIPVTQLCRERPRDFKPLYCLDPFTFDSALDRDIAVVLETCGVIRRIEDSLPAQVYHHKFPYFCLPDGRVVSAHGKANSIQVATLEDLRKILRLDESSFRFALSYISHFGFQC